MRFGLMPCELFISKYKSAYNYLIDSNRLNTVKLKFMLFRVKKHEFGIFLFSASESELMSLKVSYYFLISF